jgi:hypothetical protein
MNGGNDQVHSLRVKMPVICGMKLVVVVRSNENSSFRTDPTDPTNE